ncbi:MAG: hypothetical protein JST80_11445 [Bdellovibrionales bacterium]|nr:hypothetical protein [Bdellovibrionales bacterium]
MSEVSDVQLSSREQIMQRVHVLENIVEWVREYLENKNCEITANALFKVNGVIEQHSNFLKKMIIDYDVEYKKYDRILAQWKDFVRDAKKHVVEFTLDTKIEAAWQKWLKSKVDVLKFVPQVESFSELRKFIQACTGKCDDLDLMVLAHWMWQVKRKMNALPVKKHMMIVFTGKQGSGKSTAVSTLVSSISKYRLDLNLEALADDRHYHGLSRNFVIVCDEMQGCNKTDIEVLKHIITAEKLSARKLYTNAIDTIPLNVSFLGTSNKTLDVLIKDETGMRRFFELKCLDMMDWQAISSIDPLKMWQEIDEHNPNGYINSIQVELFMTQEGTRYRDSVETYLEETNLNSGPINKGVGQVDHVFRDYAEWCKDGELKPFDKIYFAKRMKALGVQCGRSAKSRFYRTSDDYVSWSSKSGAASMNALLKESDDVYAEIKRKDEQEMLNIQNKYKQS